MEEPDHTRVLSISLFFKTVLGTSVSGDCEHPIGRWHHSSWSSPGSRWWKGCCAGCLFRVDSVLFDWRMAIKFKCFILLFDLYDSLGSCCLQNFLYYHCGIVIRILSYVSFQVFEGTSGIDNKYTTVQFTGEVLSYFHLCFWYLVIWFFLFYPALIWNNWSNRGIFWAAKFHDMLLDVWIWKLYGNWCCRN